MGKAAGLIALPDKLVGAVVDVERGVGAVADYAIVLGDSLYPAERKFRSAGG